MATAPTNATADDGALERFLQQQRNDLMYELRRIRLGDRPVTGQTHRDNIANFIAKHIPADPAGGKENGNVANVDPVEQHRPEAVVVEVQGIVEQRHVSSMLQSLNFRRTLENIIRGSLTSVRQANAAAARTQRVTSSPRPATHVQSPADRSRSSSISSSETSGAGGEIQDSANQPVRDSTLQPSALPLSTVTVDHGTNHAMNQPVLDQGERIWDTISQVQHEEMVYEISDLLHRRLVSTALGSEFRTVMELHVQEHVSRSGTDGEAVAEFVGRIQQSQPHVPNDFRHMGIAPGPHDDGSDNISITGISATAVPYTQTNLHLSREMQSLKAQMEEMKNMLRLSFDLQMDIQRAIRQEVAAAIASATVQGATASSVVCSAPVNDTHCLICLENYTDSVLYQCGHMCVCFVCGKNLITRGNGKCPVCRAPIKDIIRAYKTNTE